MYGFEYTTASHLIICFRSCKPHKPLALSQPLLPKVVPEGEPGSLLQLMLALADRKETRMYPFSLPSSIVSSFPSHFQV